LVGSCFYARVISNISWHGVARIALPRADAKKTLFIESTGLVLVLEEEKGVCAVAFLALSA
jgi:hypothetical protein